jgi:hypothetical protein
VERTGHDPPGFIKARYGPPFTTTLAGTSLHRFAQDDRSSIRRNITMRKPTALAAVAVFAAGALLGWMTIPAIAQEKKTDKSFNPAQLADRTLHRRAVEAAIWGMPLVSVNAMRDAFFSNGAKYGDITYLSSPANWKYLVTRRTHRPTTSTSTTA